MITHQLGMSTTKDGAEPLIGVEELAEYLCVPVQTIDDWRLSGRAPRTYKFSKHLRFAPSDIADWLEQRHEGGPHDRPGIPIDGYGEIAFIHRCKGKVEARTRFRDWDGQTRLVQATASSKSAAEVALKKKLTQRNAFQPVDTSSVEEVWRAHTPGDPDAKPCLRNGEPRRAPTLMIRPRRAVLTVECD